MMGPRARLTPPQGVLETIVYIILFVVAIALGILLGAGSGWLALQQTDFIHQVTLGLIALAMTLVATLSMFGLYVAIRNFMKQTI